jgi:hypothetical protein
MSCIDNLCASFNTLTIHAPFLPSGERSIHPVCLKSYWHVNTWRYCLIMLLHLASSFRRSLTYKFHSTGFSLKFGSSSAVQEISCFYKTGDLFSIRGCNQKFPDWVDNEIYAYYNKHSLQSNITGMAAKLTRLTHKIAIQLHLVADSCAICSSLSRRSVRKLLDIPWYQQTLPLDRVLRKFNPIHTLTHNFFKSHVIIHSPRIRYPKLWLPISFST